MSILWVFEDVWVCFVCVDVWMCDCGCVNDGKELFVVGGCVMWEVVWLWDEWCVIVCVLREWVVDWGWDVRCEGLMNV